MEMEYSCGAILYCREKGQRQYVLVMEASGSYGFPKGHREGKETELETAQREIWEETGIQPVFIPNLKRTIRYKLQNSVEKEVTFFVARYDGQELRSEDKSILSVKKYDLTTALSMLKYPELRNILIEVDYILDTLGE